MHRPSAPLGRLRPGRAGDIGELPGRERPRSRAARRADDGDDAIILRRMRSASYGYDGKRDASVSVETRVGAIPATRLCLGPTADLTEGSMVQVKGAAVRANES